jgi:hypothetical protein
MTTMGVDVSPADDGTSVLGEFAGRLGQLLVEVLHLPDFVRHVRQVSQRAVENQNLDKGGLP